MSRPNSTSYDVFLSSSHADREVAKVVRHAIEDRGLSVFTAEDVPADAPPEDLIRSAMADARVFVAILSPLSVGSAMIAIELGAALAWGKAIFLLLEGLEPGEVPRSLAGHRAIRLSNLSTALREIERSIEPITENQARALGEIYASVGVSTEQLATQPTSLDLLTRQFNQRLGVSYPAERVLQELIRLRKKGVLPKTRRRTG